MEVTQDGLAFVTSGVSYPPMSGQYHAYLVEKNIKGRVYLFDFKKPKLGARSLNIRQSKAFDPETFHPHGISMLEDKVKGNHLLYVVNHVKGGNDRVEKFRFLPASLELEHVR
ncbi:serum paraoxonase/arylesterase 1 [Elysia marginata]|uniref:Serum paraoxonase/arylesterase 1 n=1 Tax=Elysia marginata TaxID=1093978 RepID=A0AAV4INJ0_9GAST|nr:serum paraoxonase/arylesterase 1 [Elysia marginata]